MQILLQLILWGFLFVLTVIYFSLDSNVKFKLISAVSGSFRFRMIDIRKCSHLFYFFFILLFVCYTSCVCFVNKRK